MSTESQASPPLPPPFNNTTPPPTLLAQGAEARLYKTTYLTPSIPAALKIRPSKPYRHVILDRRLTKQRILHEARCLARLRREGVPVPTVLALDWEGPLNTATGERSVGAWLLMEWIEGPSVRAVLEKWEAWVKRASTEREQRGETFTVSAEEDARVIDLMARIGQAVGHMHRVGIVHGDLTTSNLILRPLPGSPPGQVEESSDADKEPPSLEGEIVLIDFGLAMQSVHEEDRAVDLYVLERAIGSTHPRTERYFSEVLQAYRQSFKGASTVLRRLEEVRMRGRKRSMIG